VTGELGGAAATLARLAESKPVGAKYSMSSTGHISRQSPPQARVTVGQSLRRRGLASAMIDLSDGLSTDLEHICQESRVGAEIEAEAIPRAQLGKKRVGLEFALHGGAIMNCYLPRRRRFPRRLQGAGDADRPNREIRRNAADRGRWKIDAAQG